VSPQESLQRAAVVAEARTWLGTPYHHQGDVKGVGVDCAMILVRVFNACGVIPAIDPRPYPMDWALNRSAERYLGWLAQYGRPVQAPAPGDVAIWRFGRAFSHAAIVVGQAGELIHSYRGVGVVEASMAEEALATRPVQFYSLWQEA